MPEDKKSDDVVEETNVTIEPEQPEEPSEEPAEAEDTTDKDTEEPSEPKGPNALQKLWKKYLAKKKITIPATVVVLLAIIFGVPATRYEVLGLGLKNDLHVHVIDSQTNIAVSGVDVTIRGKAAKTDGDGKATIKGVSVGPFNLTASKKYYKDFNGKTTVPIRKQKNDVEIKLEATGRQIAVHITNKVNGKNIGGATVKAADTEATTDENGETTLVLPAEKVTVDAVISASGFNSQNATINITKPGVRDNTFQLVPAGKVYFLSKLSGKIDVVKTDLDGSNRKTVLAGTGKEEEGNTVLLASRDWKYLALLSRRDSAKPKLYLLDTSNDKLTEIDSGDATFNLAGWSDHNFMYTAVRGNLHLWQPKQSALKTYNADSSQLLTVDETNAEGTSDNDYAGESIGTVYIVDGRAVYAKNWYANYYSVYRLAGKRMTLISVKANGLDKQTLKDFDSGSSNFINTALSKPDELYVRALVADHAQFFEYTNGKLSTDDEMTDDSFYKPYPTYLQSPSGQAAFWFESRDGKNTLFTGTKNGGSPVQIASLSEYSPYGWFSDDYLLVSKNSSELYILPKEGGKNPLKITDYHKPDVSYLGYGGGYGGL